MRRTGKFVTPEELEGVKAAQATSGMFLSGGEPIGDPQKEAYRLCEKYDLDVNTHALDVRTGEFISV